MKLFFSIFFTLLLILIVYEQFIITPQTNVKKALLKEYELCKKSNLLQHELNWIRQCNTVSPLSKECKEILANAKENIWDLFHSHNQYLKAQYLEYKESSAKYLEMTAKLSECSCETLPKNNADMVNNSLREQNQDCQKDLEIKSGVLL